MRYLSILLLIGVTLKVNGQQINPVPDYIFRNSMSVGRNAPTDTSAYFSIGPRFGATRGFMPPMVVDTAAVTGTKRNGLLIYSIQRNSFLYWDSTGMRWSRIAANLDTLLLSTRAWRQKGDDSLAAIINTRTDTVNLLSTKAWRQKGIDSVAGLSRVTGSGLSGQVSFWNGTTSQQGDSALWWNNSQKRLGVGTSSPTAPFEVVTNSLNQGLSIRGRASDDRASIFIKNNAGTANSAYLDFAAGGNTISIVNEIPLTFRTFDKGRLQIKGNGEIIADTSGTLADAGAYNFQVQGNMYSTTGPNVFNATSGETLFGTSVDAGDYRVQIAGSLYNTTGAVLAASSGNVGIGGTSAPWKLTVNGADMTVTSSGTNITVSALSSEGRIRSNKGMAFDVNTTLTTAMYIDTSRFVGINTFFPSYRLDVSGNIRVTTGGVIASSSGELLVGSTTDNGAYVLQSNGAFYTSSSITTGAPTGGTAQPWKLGTVATVSPTSPNRTIEVEVNGTIYYLHAKTTND